MPSFVASRLKDVAAELEEYYERSLQRTEQAHADALARVSQLEVQAMQHQLASLRLEAQLHDANVVRAQLEQQCQHLKDDNLRLREAASVADETISKSHVERINVRALQGSPSCPGHTYRPTPARRNCPVS